jgi:hypothetical protein
MAPSLDHEIAAGARLDSELLVERARLLLRPKYLHRLADSLDRLLEPPPVAGPATGGPPPVDRSAVREASALLISISLRLRDDQLPPPGVRGLAMLTCLLGDPEAPLYVPGSGSQSCDKAREIIAEL